MRVRIKKAGDLPELRRLVNAIFPDDPGYQIIVTKHATATEDAQFIVVWREGDVAE